MAYSTSLDPASLKTPAFNQVISYPSEPTQPCLNFNISRDLQNNLLGHVNHGLKQNWTAPNAIAPKTKQETEFLKTHNLSSLLYMPPPQPQKLNWVQELTISVACATASQAVNSGIQEIMTETPTVTSHDGNSTNKEHISSEGRVQNSEEIVIKEHIENHAKEIVFNEVKTHAVERVHNTLGPIHSAHVNHGINVVSGSIEFAGKLSTDPSREGLLDLAGNAAIDQIGSTAINLTTKGFNQLIPVVFRTAVSNGTTAGLNAFFDSPNLNENNDQMLMFERVSAMNLPTLPREPIVERVLPHRSETAIELNNPNAIEIRNYTTEPSCTIL